MERPKRRQVKITSDGTVPNTHVLDLESGEELPCREVEFRAAVDDLPFATLEISMPILEYEGKAEIVLVNEDGDEIGLSKEVPKLRKVLEQIKSTAIYPGYSASEALTVIKHKAESALLDSFRRAVR